MTREIDDLSERYSKLLATKKAGTHISWVAARDVLRMAIREAYELGRERAKQPAREPL